MSFISTFDKSTGTITKISEDANGILEFPAQHEGVDIKIIARKACYDNQKVTEIDFSKTKITMIQSYAFGFCLRITKITLPSTIITLEKHALRRTAISEIKIPSTVQNFDAALSYSTSLNFIDVSENNRFLSAPEGIYNTDYTRLIIAYANIQFTSITHYDTIKSFAEYAFCGTNLDRFTCTEKITEIPEGLFENCPNIYEVDLVLSPATLIGINCFRFDRALKTVILPPNLKTIKNGVFEGCSLSCVFLPSSLTDIDKEAFVRQEGLTRVFYFGSKNFDVDAFTETTIEPLIYVPLDYKYEKLFKRAVTRADLSDTFTTKRCPITNYCNNQFKISQQFLSYNLIISLI